MRLQPITFAEACAFVETHHRHHAPPRGHIASIAASVEDRVVGVAILGRPVARGFNDTWTIELTRLCTDGTRNAASFLLGASRRLAAALGYKRAITYTLDTEPGASLNAAGWQKAATVRGRSWSCKSRPRVDKHPTQGKIRWECPVE